MTYGLYADEWHLNHTVTTGIFAVYPVVVVVTLIGFGDISDHIGRRATMLMGLGASLAGTLLFAVPPDACPPAGYRSGRGLSIPGMPPICSARKSTSRRTRAMPARSGTISMLSGTGGSE
jgi:MFS family permease